MNLFLEQKALADYISRQLQSIFPFGRESQTRRDILQILPTALERTEYCFSKVKAKYFQRNGGPFFSPLMTDQYAMFLYLLANTSFKAEKDPLLADRLYGLNKMLHSIDVYYQIELPGIFLFVHSVGTVLGRATYGDYLVVYQGVTVGGNLDYEYPIIHDGVALFSNSSVLGRSVLNRGVSVSARTFLMNTEVDENHICFGQHPHVEVKPARRSVTDHFFNTGKGNE